MSQDQSTTDDTKFHNFKVTCGNDCNQALRTVQHVASGTQPTTCVVSSSTTGAPPAPAASTTGDVTGFGAQSKTDTTTLSACSDGLQSAFSVVDGGSVTAADCEPVEPADESDEPKVFTVQYVLVHPTIKKPVHDGWKHEYPTKVEVQRHRKSGGKVGFVPAPMGVSVVDNDIDDPAKAALFDASLPEVLDAQPVASIPSGTAPHMHHFYVSPLLGADGKPINKHLFAFQGEYSGEVIGGKGVFVIIYDLAEFAKVVEIARERWDDPPPPIDFMRLPKSSKKRTAAAGGKQAGGRATAAFDEGFKAGLKGNAELKNKAIQAAIDAGLDDDDGKGESARNVNNGYDAGLQVRAEQNDQQAKFERGELVGTVEQNDEVLPLDARLKARKTELGLLGALTALGIKLRFNARSQVAQWCGVAGTKAGEWHDANDTLEQSIIALLERKFATFSDQPTPLKFGTTAWEHCTKSLHHRYVVDTYEDWLTGLAAHDGVPRLKSLITDCFSVSDADNELAAWLGGYILIACVKRTLQPGCKLDEVPVLVGTGGLGKSTFFKYLLPDEQYFNDALCLDDAPQRQVEALRGNVIVEISEMSGVRKADAARMKARISSTHDQIRAAYARHNPKVPRRCVLVGTADKTQCLPDDTNLRRFIPIRVDVHDSVDEADDVRSDKQPLLVRRYLEANREQLWAEALAQYQANPDQEVYLPNRLVARQKANTARHRHVPEPALEERVLAVAADVRGGEILTAGELLKKVEPDETKHDRSLRTRIGLLAEACGFDSDRQYHSAVGGKCTVYVRRYESLD